MTNEEKITINYLYILAVLEEFMGEDYFFSKQGIRDFTAALRLLNRKYSLN